jgi:antitoxin CptB
MTSARARLAWRCRRGTKELDLLLSGYLERRHDAAAPDERAAFERLLDLPDSELIGLLCGQTPPVDPAIDSLVAEIRACAAR